MKNMEKNNKFNFIRYSNCWEDTDNLLESLNIEQNVGLSILSAGDNTLSMLIKNPKKIVAFDVNSTQIYLFNLKKAGFKYLEYEDLIKLLGVYNTHKSYKIFLSLEDKLDKDTFEYFVKRPEYFKRGILNIGKFENYFHIFRKYIIPLFTTKSNINKLASFEEIDIQKDFYERKINNKRLNFIFNIFFGFKVMGKLGRDKSFYKYVDEKKKSAKNIKFTFDYGITHIANYNNQYINYILLNKFNEECLPIYLRKENFVTIRNNIDKIEVIRSNLTNIEGKYDFFNLSDIFEYMSETEFKQNIKKIKDISNKGARIAYYNMQNKRYIKSKEFIYLEELSKKLTLKTKSYFYRDFLVYKVGEDKDEYNS